MIKYLVPFLFFSTILNSTPKPLMINEIAIVVPEEYNYTHVNNILFKSTSKCDKNLEFPPLSGKSYRIEISSATDKERYFVFVGGRNHDGTFSDIVDIYKIDSIGEKFIRKKTFKLPEGRCGSSVFFIDNLLVIAGGYNIKGFIKSVVYQDIDKLFESESKWLKGPNLSESKAYMTLVKNGDRTGLYEGLKNGNYSSRFENFYRDPNGQLSIATTRSPIPNINGMTPITYDSSNICNKNKAFTISSYLEKGILKVIKTRNNSARITSD